MTIRAAISFCLGGLFLALVLSSPASAQQVGQTNLGSDQGGIANNQDINLIDAFGLARGTGTDWMIAARGTALSLSYDGAGNNLFSNVTIPPAVSTAGAVGLPTGVVFNGTTSFNVPNSAVPAQFLFATADGAIAAYNPNVDPSNAFLAINNSAKGASYTGLTIAEVRPGVFHLYAANFKKGTIDVFDGNYNPVAFTTPIPQLGFGGNLAPYNIQALGKDLAITFAVRGSNGQVVAGKGFGLVSITNVKGNPLSFLKDSSLNAPYGIAQAPADFGRLSHTLLIANSGNGTIAAFDPFSGKFITLLVDTVSGNTLTIDGLHSLGFGAQFAADFPNNTFQASPVQNGSFNALYFTAGPVGGTHGLFGDLVPPTADFVLGEQ